MSSTNAGVIRCTNNGAFLMEFSIQWQLPDQSWVTGNWSSGWYPVTQTCTSPPIDSPAVGFPANAIAVRPLAQAWLSGGASQ